MPRSSYYYKPREDLHKRYMDATAKDEIMQIYLETPFYGIRRITGSFTAVGITSIANAYGVCAGRLVCGPSIHDLTSTRRSLTPNTKSIRTF